MMRKLFKLTLVVIGWTFLGLITHHVGIDKITKLLQDANHTQIIIGLIVFSFVHILKGIKWRILFRDFITIKDSISLYAIASSYAVFFPFRLTDVLLAPILAKSHNLTYKSSLSRLLLDKLFDLTIIFIFAIPALFYFGKDFRLYDKPSLAAFLLITLMLIAPFMVKLKREFNTKQLNLTASSKILHSKAMIQLFAFSNVAFLFELIAGYMLVDAFYPIEAYQYIFLKPLSILAGIISLIPGGIGIESFSLGLLFSWIGAGSSELLAAIVCVRLITLVMILFYGSGAFFWAPPFKANTKI